MCGGELTLPDGVYSGTCAYCGSLTTFPRITDAHLETLHNRAEQLRRVHEYDQAINVYSQIIAATPDDPEAYWGMVLCRYGIEYVEDPVSRERIPTCHRVQFESILNDIDYLSALDHAGSVEREIYRKEADRIADIQKNILTISNQEDKFDVFICYKESTSTGQRTRDSLIAQDIYHALDKNGYKVFFARITLENKLGQQYEPYIFAALNSAKVMLVIGSSKENFNAVWVKNEWSRFLSLIKKDRSKLLIPCYKDMDAYDIPEELSMLQAQDMNKIGFMQDLLHGIDKIIPLKKSAGSPAAAATGKNNPLLRRAKIFMDDGDFPTAFQYCENTLDQEPENGWAYFYKMQAEYGISDEKFLAEIFHIRQNKNFAMAEKFADEELAALINRIITTQQNYYQQSNDSFILSPDRTTLVKIKPDSVISGEVIIPPGITRIGANVFSHCENITRIVVPEGVTGIDNNVFLGCTRLSVIQLPLSLKYIGAAAFVNCVSLTAVTIPEGVENLGHHLFSGCVQLQSLSLPSTIKFVGQDAFINCPNLSPTAIHRQKQPAATLDDKLTDSWNKLQNFFKN